MLGYIENWMRGRLRISASSADAEGFIADCQGMGVELIDIRRRDEITFTAEMYPRDFRKIRRPARRRGCRVRIVKKKGLFRLAAPARRHPVFIAGLAVCLLLLYAMSGFVWTVSIVGEGQNNAALAADLAGLGVRPGVWGGSVREEQLKHQILLLYGELSWVGIEREGSRVTVDYRLRHLPPEMEDYTVPRDMVSTRTGLITKMVVLRGRPLYSAGQTVVRGERIVTGLMEAKDGYRWTVHSDAVVTAKTWYELTALAPASAEYKEYTGRSQKRIFVQVGRVRRLVWGGGEVKFVDYEKRVEYKRFSEDSLPITLVIEEYFEYNKVNIQNDGGYLEDLLVEILEKGLSDGEILSYTTESGAGDGVNRLSLSAVCSEQIAAPADYLPPPDPGTE